MASVYPLFKLTSAPDVSATVLFDFNNVDSPSQQIYVNAGGFSIGVPSLAGDPDSIFPQYGSRTVSLGVSIVGSRAYAMGKVSVAAGLLLRDNCWLMFQLSSTTQPAWFKLYRPQPGDLSFDGLDLDRTKNTWGWQISLPAEPFAYGARVTLGPVTINNNPAAGTNPCSYVFPAIKGDAPAPLTAQIYPGAETCSNALLGVAPLPSSWAGPYVWQSSAFGPGVDTSATETTDSTFSASNYRSISFSTSQALVPRLSGVVPAMPPRGRYRLLARVARSDTSSAFTVQGAIKQQTGGTVAGSIQTVSGPSTAATWATLVDLGSFAFPAGGDLPTLPTLSGSSVPAELEFRAGRTSGTGSLRVDYFLLIPEMVNGEAARNLRIDNSANGFWGSPWDSLVVDGDSDRTAWLYISSEAFFAAPALSGGFPVVTPGFTNVLHFIPHIDPTAIVNGGLGGTLNNADSISATTQVTLSYHPRWLFIGDGS